jgi:transcriptional regulator with XRE-family HTH domain
VTDYQQARAALGARLQELRVSRPGGRFTTTQLAAELGWSQSKVSKLENGKVTAKTEDLTQWAEATGRPEAAAELHASLRGLESHNRAWRRQLTAGHRHVQDRINQEHAQSKTIRGWQPAMIPGILQTPDYARAIFLAHAELQQSTKDTEEAVRARIKRQENLYKPGKRYRLLIWEAALYALICLPSELVAQLDRLAGVIGLSTVELGIVPLAASLKITPGAGFLIHDERLAVVETWHAELWVNDVQGVATYLRTWQTLQESAVYGADAHRIITRAGHAIGTR